MSIEFKGHLYKGQTWNFNRKLWHLWNSWTSERKKLVSSSQLYVPISILCFTERKKLVSSSQLYVSKSLLCFTERKKLVSSSQLYVSKSILCFTERKKLVSSSQLYVPISIPTWSHNSNILTWSRMLLSSVVRFPTVFVVWQAEFELHCWQTICSMFLSHNGNNLLRICWQYSLKKKIPTRYVFQCTENTVT